MWLADVLMCWACSAASSKGVVLVCWQRSEQLTLSALGASRAHRRGQAAEARPRLDAAADRRGVRLWRAAGELQPLQAADHRPHNRPGARFWGCNSPCNAVFTRTPMATKRLAAVGSQPGDTGLCRLPVDSIPMFQSLNPGPSLAPQQRTVEAPSVAVTQVVTEGELVQHSELFENSIAGGDRGALRDFCASKAAGAQVGRWRRWRRGAGATGPSGMAGHAAGPVYRMHVWHLLLGCCLPAKTCRLRGGGGKVGLRLLAETTRCSCNRRPPAERRGGRDVDVHGRAV